MTVAYLVGVVEDGSERGVFVPNDARRALRANVGSGLLVRVAIVRPSGDPVGVRSTSATLTIRRRSWDANGDAEYRLVVAITATSSFSEGRVDFLIPAEAINLFEAQTYAYDVWWTDTLGVERCVLSPSAFIVEPATDEVDDIDITDPPVVTSEQILALTMNAPSVAEVTSS